MKDTLLYYQAALHGKLLRLTESDPEEGMATAEYAIGTIAAAAFAGVLLVVVKSGGIKAALTALIKQALQI
ncbi:MAG: DUF4244 domain-containing protein [Actinomycetaceae bacterium]|nr:DUF4244 domain-containing protein [Actinomycetaceae bacterium]